MVHTAYYYDANGKQTSVVEKVRAAGTTKTDCYAFNFIAAANCIMKDTMLSSISI